ncbi:MAG: peptidoglycan DD-metalloendopeptidase family protein [Pseudomonadota bacterium]
MDKLQVRLQQKREDVADSTGELIAQLRSAYVHGTQGAIQLLLNSNDPVSMARDTTYFGYLARHRRSHLQRLRRVLNELGELDRQFKQKLQEQLGLEDEARAALVKLEGALQSRQEALATLEQKLKSQDQQAERLAVEEAALTQLLQELRDLLSEYPVQTEEAFAGLKGALQWPLPGQLIHDFGQPRAPKMRWQGLVIGATEGSRVRSIARGRVSYADWLPGMGQLVIVDHGGGYMSLYGYNQLLTRAVGDWVAPGDTIALVGDTGGQIQSSLYFEIRAGGQPQNPHTWFKSSLPAPK